MKVLWETIKRAFSRYVWRSDPPAVRVKLTLAEHHLLSLNSTLGLLLLTGQFVEAAALLAYIQRLFTLGDNEDTLLRAVEELQRDHLQILQQNQMRPFGHIESSEERNAQLVQIGITPVTTAMEEEVHKTALAMALRLAVIQQLSPLNTEIDDDDEDVAPSAFPRMGFGPMPGGMDN